MEYKAKIVVKGKKGLVKHNLLFNLPTYKSWKKDFKIGSLVPATGNRDFLRYGGKSAKLISIGKLRKVGEAKKSTKNWVDKLLPF